MTRSGTGEGRGVLVAACTRTDRGLAALVTLVALCTYIRTLAPGLIPITDTPGFQFVGRVLGTLHNPGYPAYVLITHAWSYLPIGSLAYRINLFSAVMGAVTAGGVVLLIRLLGGGRVVAAAAALAMAFGSIFWSQSVIAEVYTLNAALVVWMLVAIVAWRRSGRAGLFYGAFGLLALGLGNHTTIVLFAPGMLLYALACDWRFALKPRTVLITLGLLAAGLAQYGFILLRSGTPGVYLESRASTLPELLHVVRGAQFEHALFPFDVRTVMTSRVELIIGRFVGSELTIPVLLLAVVGALAILTRRRREALLILTGAATSLLFVLNYDAGDIHVFTIPLLAVLWVCAAVGAEGAVALVGRRSQAAAAGASVLVAAFVVWQGARNFTARDLSGDTAAIHQMDALFAALPGDSFLIRENFILDRMLMYKLLGERAAGQRRIQVHYVSAAGLGPLIENRRTVFAFEQMAHRLRFEGVAVSFAPLAVYPWSLSERLEQLPAGSVVALGLPGMHARSFHQAAGTRLDTVADLETLRGHDQSALALIGVADAPQLARARAGARSESTVEHGDLRVKADAVGASIWLADRELARTEDGAVLGVMDPDGRLQTVAVLTPDTGYRVRSSHNSFTPYRVLGTTSPSHPGPDWSEVDSSQGMILFRLAAGAEATVLAEARAGCDLRAVEKSSADLKISSIGGTPPPPYGTGNSPYQRLVLSAASSAGAGGALVATGCSTRVLAAAHTGEVTAYPGSFAAILDVPGRSRETVVMARTAQSWLLGAGWSAVETERSGAFRWLVGPVSSLALPVGRSGTHRLRILARAPEAAVGLGLALAVDGHSLETQPLSPGWQSYEWILPEPLTPGLHHLTIRPAGVPPGREVSGGWLAVATMELLPPRTW